jgi:hypothetical protein
LLAVFAATLATLLVPVPFTLQASDYGDIPLGSCKAHTRYWGGGGPVELLHFSHYISLVQWTKRLLPTTGGSGSRPGGATALLERGSPVSVSRYTG